MLILFNDMSWLLIETKVLVVYLLDNCASVKCDVCTDDKYGTCIVCNGIQQSPGNCTESTSCHAVCAKCSENGNAGKCSVCITNTYRLTLSTQTSPCGDGSCKYSWYITHSNR